MSQLILPLGSNPRHTFANFYAGSNDSALKALVDLPSQDGLVWLSGPDNSGKSHLLQAICHQAKAQNESSAYLPLRQMCDLGPEAAEGLEQCARVCLDDADQVLGIPEWEQQLFALINQALDHGTTLLMSAAVPATHVAVKLNDLRSRLVGSTPFHLQPLEDEEQMEALRRRAKSQGYAVSHEAVRYLQRQVSRDLGELCQLLDQLEQHALSKQRKITVPFVRAILINNPELKYGQ